MIGAWTNKAFSMIETITAAESQRPVQARINISAGAAILHISNYSEAIKKKLNSATWWFWYLRHLKQGFQRLVSITPKSDCISPGCLSLLPARWTSSSIHSTDKSAPSEWQAVSSDFVYFLSHLYMYSLEFWPQLDVTLRLKEAFFLLLFEHWGVPKRLLSFFIHERY